MKVLNSSVEIRVEIAARPSCSPVIPHLSAVCTISVHCGRAKNIFFAAHRAHQPKNIFGAVQNRKDTLHKKKFED
jgi:hypothetical protein